MNTILQEVYMKYESKASFEKELTTAYLLCALVDLVEEGAKC